MRSKTSDSVVGAVSSSQMVAKAAADAATATIPAAVVTRSRTVMLMQENTGLLRARTDGSANAG